MGGAAKVVGSILGVSSPKTPAITPVPSAPSASDEAAKAEAAAAAAARGGAGRADNVVAGNNTLGGGDDYSVRKKLLGQ